jgi:hypothetical protein
VIRVIRDFSVALWVILLLTKPSGIQEPQLPNQAKCRVCRGNGQITCFCQILQIYGNGVPAPVRSWSDFSSADILSSG